jgi:hypothetical protein
MAPQASTQILVPLGKTFVIQYDSSEAFDNEMNLAPWRFRNGNSAFAIVL